MLVMTRLDVTSGEDTRERSPFPIGDEGGEGEPARRGLATAETSTCRGRKSADTLPQRHRVGKVTGPGAPALRVLTSDLGLSLRGRTARVPEAETELSKLRRAFPLRGEDRASAAFFCMGRIRDRCPIREGRFCS